MRGFYLAWVTLVPRFLAWLAAVPFSRALPVNPSVPFSALSSVQSGDARRFMRLYIGAAAAGFVITLYTSVLSGPQLFGNASLMSLNITV